jgi:hypothetical protein
MSVEQAIYPRGKIAGVCSTPTNRSDEAYVEFIEDARNILLHAQLPKLMVYVRQSKYQIADIRLLRSKGRNGSAAVGRYRNT